MCFQEQLLVCVSCNAHALCKYSSSSFHDGRSQCGLEEFRVELTSHTTCGSNTSRLFWTCSWISIVLRGVFYASLSTAVSAGVFKSSLPALIFISFLNLDVLISYLSKIPCHMKRSKENCDCMAYALGRYYTHQTSWYVAKLTSLFDIKDFQVLWWVLTLRPPFRILCTILLWELCISAYHD